MITGIRVGTLVKLIFFSVVITAIVTAVVVTHLVSAATSCS